MVYSGSFVVSFFVFSHFCPSFIFIKSDFWGIKDVCNVSEQSVTIFQLGLAVNSTESYWRMSKDMYTFNHMWSSVRLRKVVARMSPMGSGWDQKSVSCIGNYFGIGYYLGIGYYYATLGNWTIIGQYLSTGHVWQFMPGAGVSIATSHYRGGKDGL